MAIEVKHGVGAGAVAAAGFAAGQGATRNKFQEGQLNAIEQRKRLASQQDFAADQADRGRQHQQTIDQENYEWKQDQATEKRNRELDVYRGKIRADKYTTGDEKRRLLRLVDAEEAGLKTAPRTRRSKFKKGQGVGDIWESPRGNIFFSRGKDEKAYKIGDTGKASQKDRADTLKAIISSLPQEDLGGVDWETVKIRMKEVGFPMDDNPDPTSTPEGGQNAEPSASAASGSAEDFNRANPLELPGREPPTSASAAPGSAEDFNRANPLELPGREPKVTPEPLRPKKKGEKITKGIVAQYVQFHDSIEAARAAAKRDGWSF